MSEGFGTIMSCSGSRKIGLDNSSPPIVKAILEDAVAKWTVQNVDDNPDHYRLFVNDGQRDYALRASENSISSVEGKPASLDSHGWKISKFPDGYYSIKEPTDKAWKLNGDSIELAACPGGNDGLEPFKFKFTFSG